MKNPLLPSIESYSKEQLSEASRECPAISKYLHLIRQSSENASDELRIERHRLWLQSALSVFFQNRSPQEICLFWSRSALTLIKKAWSQSGLDQEDLALFALGKLGSLELNLSSDVDLLVVGSPLKPEDASQKLRAFKKILHEPTPFGFALRVDFDLRPDGAWGPLIISIPHFQDHYWSRGETWERLALLRLRHVAGKDSIASEITDLATRFCFRKFLDYTLMEDLKSLRARINQKSFRSTESPFDLKHGIGGIRDAELFIHSLQVIHGGRNLNLRSSSTSEAAAALASALPELQADILSLANLYWQLRDLENQVQILNDEQTHLLFNDSRYPAMSPHRWTELQSLTSNVNAIVSRLLGDLDTESTRLPKSTEHQQEWLRGLGFSEDSVARIWPEIIKSSALSYKKDRDEILRQEFLFTFVNHLGHQKLDKDLALAVFLDFIRSARAKSTLFTLILRNENLMQKLVTLFSHSPYMGQIIASRPELIDSFLYGQLEFSDDTAENLQLLFERKQLSEVTSAVEFFSHQDPNVVSLHLTSTADAIAESLKKMVLAELPGSQFDILCLGKWGSQEMGYNSDLDFVLVKDGPIEAVDHRAARKFIHYLTSAQRGGRIYDIDMRLRPSGSSGPILVSYSSLIEYLKEKAAPWERQSYLRVRTLQPESLTWDGQILFNKPLSSDELLELKRIRSELLRTPSEDRFDLKYAPGGLIDLEFAIQLAILKHQIIPSLGGATAHLLKTLSQHHKDWAKHAEFLLMHYTELRKLEQMLRLSTQSSTTQIDFPSSSMLRVAQLLNQDEQSLFEHIRQQARQANALLKHLDPIYGHD